MFASGLFLHSSYKHLQSKNVCMCVCVQMQEQMTVCVCVPEWEKQGVESDYSVCAMPNTSSIFVYSPPLLFSHRMMRKTHTLNTLLLAVTRIQTHTHINTDMHMYAFALILCSKKPTAVTFQMQMEQQLPTTAKMSTSSAPSLQLRQAKLAAG